MIKNISLNQYTWFKQGVYTSLIVVIQTQYLLFIIKNIILYLR